MAQGLLKSKPKPSSTTHKKSTSTHHTSSGVTKKGALHFNPKNKKLAKQAKLNKKLTSGLTAQTERMLSEKAGHLELIGKGRDKKGSGGAGGKKEVGGGKKGGKGK